MYVCMYGPFWPRRARKNDQTYIHTYIHGNFIYVFVIFWTFSSKNVALAVEMGMPKFKNFEMYVSISSAGMGKHTWNSSFEVV